MITTEGSHVETMPNSVKRCLGLACPETAIHDICALQRNVHPLLRLETVLSVVLVLAFAALPAHGQAFGTISGVITDPRGAVVPGAKITATEADTSFSRNVVSDSRGQYIIPNLRPTQYTL